MKAKSNWAEQVFGSNQGMLTWTSASDHRVSQKQPIRVQAGMIEIPFSFATASKALDPAGRGIKELSSPLSD